MRETSGCRLVKKYLTLLRNYYNVARSTAGYQPALQRGGIRGRASRSSARRRARARGARLGSFCHFFETRQANRLPCADGLGRLGVGRFPSALDLTERAVGALVSALEASFVAGHERQGPGFLGQVLEGQGQVDTGIGLKELFFDFGLAA